MSQYYCHQCAISNSLVSPASPSSLISGSYQLDKFIAHTAPSASHLEKDINSVFSDPTYKGYSTYVVNTTASGFLEIDSGGHKNLIWFAGSQTGIEYRKGAFFAPSDGVKVVWPENDDKLHAFPIASSPLQSVVCTLCGRPIPFV
jgi:hypothetical protein